MDSIDSINNQFDLETEDLQDIIRKFNSLKHLFKKDDLNEFLDRLYLIKVRDLLRVKFSK